MMPTNSRKLLIPPAAPWTTPGNQGVRELEIWGTHLSITGEWQASTVASGFEGGDYQHHAPHGPSPEALVVDNEDAGFSVTGTWPASTAGSGYLGGDYQANAAGSGADVATWTFNVPDAGDYQVYARWTSHSNRATNAPYTVTHDSVTVNQQQNGGQYQSNQGVRELEILRELNQTP